MFTCRARLGLDGEMAPTLEETPAHLELGDELLKKTDVGNLFMVFGEPDIGAQALLGRSTT
jgi:hypothetical protein